MRGKTAEKSDKIVFLFTEEGGPVSPAVLGGKGAGLAEMARSGVPVPFGFTVTTAVARAFAQFKRLPQRLDRQIRWGIAALERQTGKGFGNGAKPLLVSVRSGAPVSMPGMMDTVLNLGLNPSVVRGMAESAGNRLAWDCYRRFLSMFGDVVLHVPRERFNDILRDARQQQGVSLDSELEAAVLEQVCGSYRSLIEANTGRPVPDDPWEQLELAITAVLRSWGNQRAKAYRQAHGISEHSGTAVTIQAMVFGNHGNDSGTGVVFSRNVATGAPGLWGEFIPNAQGEDVVAGVRTPLPISEMKAWNPTVYAELDRIVRELETRRADAVDVEFTVEQGRLYILQVRAAKRTPEAAVTIATHFVWEKRWTKEDALARVTPEQIEAIKKSLGFEPKALEQAVATRLLARGLPASPGAVVGRVALTSEAAVSSAAKGEKIILVRSDTSPDDLPGMLAAAAVVTKTGGATSHAAVVCRGLGKAAVVGCGELRVSEGDLISVDGQTGVVVLGEVELATLAQKKEVNLFLRWVARVEALKWPKPRLALDKVNESVSVNRLINDFYLADAMAQASARTALEPDAVVVRNQVHVQVAERLAAYLAVACSGELRHHDNWLECKDALATLRDKFKVKKGGYRGDAQVPVVDQLKKSNLEEQAEFLELAAAVFARGRWSSSYGGQKWAAIAQAAHGFVTGRLSHSVFADHAFDLQHNSGSVFGKHKMLTGDRGPVHRQLEEKKHAKSVLDLRARLRTISTSLAPEVEELYIRGEKFGVWASEQKKAV